MKILITGAAGFIGFFLCKKLLERNEEIIGLDNINDYYDLNLKYARLNELGIPNKIEDGELISSKAYPSFQFIKGDIENKKLLMNLFEKERFDIVVNLAAQAGVRYSLENPTAYIYSNIVGFLNLLEVCREYPVRHFVYASSSSVYGANTKMPFNTRDCISHPVSLYAATKKSNELMAHTYSHLFNIPTTGLRFFTVYGPWGRPDMSPILFANAIAQGETIKVFNHGEMQRDFTYIDDIVDGVVRVIDKPSIPNTNWNGNDPDPASSYAPYKIYNIGNSAPVKLMDFISEIEKGMGQIAKKQYLPMQSGDVVATWANVDDLKKDVGYNPTTSITDGVQRFIEWYKAYYVKKNAHV